MSTTFWTVAVILFASLCIFLAMVFALVRRVKELFRELQAFQRAVQPTLEAIRADGQRAQERIQDLPADRQAFVRRAAAGGSTGSSG